MQNPYFTERQILRQHGWVLPLVIVTIVGTLTPLGIGMYNQLVMNEPWGNEPMSNEGLIAMFVVALICVAILGWVLLSIKMETRIDAEGIHYRFFPHQWQWKLITPQEISSHTIRDKFNFFESGKLGYHRNWFIKTRSMRIYGPHNLRLELTNGHKLIIGTQDPQGMEWAMKRMLHKKGVS